MYVWVYHTWQAVQAFIVQGAVRYAMQILTSYPEYKRFAETADKGWIERSVPHAVVAKLADLNISG